MEKDAKTAVAMLEQERKKIEAAGLEPPLRDALLRNCDRNLTDLQQYIEKNRPRLELAQKNNDLRSEIDREKQAKLDRQQKIAAKVDEYNRLMEEQRWAEAGVVLKQAAELDPNDRVVQQLKISWRIHLATTAATSSIKEKKEDGVVAALQNVRSRPPIPFDDQDPYRFPDPKDWKSITSRRAKLARDRQRRRNERELEIEKKLTTPVSVAFHKRPAEQGAWTSWPSWPTSTCTSIRRACGEEGVSPDTPVTHRTAQRDHAQERAEPDPGAAAPELRGQGRSAEDHQRADAGRAGLHGDLPGGRPGDADSEFRGQSAAWAWPARTTTRMGNVGFGGSGPFGTPDHARWPWWPAATASRAAARSTRA